MINLNIPERALDVACDNMLKSGLFEPYDLPRGWKLVPDPIEKRLAEDQSGDEYERDNRPAAFDQE